MRPLRGVEMRIPCRRFPEVGSLRVRTAGYLKVSLKPIRIMQVDPHSHTLPYDELWPYRPEVSEGGFTAVCPYCHHSGLYERFQLTLRSPDTASLF